MSNGRAMRRRMSPFAPRIDTPLHQPPRPLTMPRPMVAYGARCAWWDDKTHVGTAPPWVSPTGKAMPGLPCCPHCHGVLFESEMTKWWEDAHLCGVPALAERSVFPDARRGPGRVRGDAMTAVDLDFVANEARHILAAGYALDGPRILAEHTLLLVDETVVLRELVEQFEYRAAVLDAERLSVAESAEMWRGKALELPGRDMVLRLVADHDHVGSHPIVTRRYPELDPPAVFHDCLACMVTWEEGRD